MGVILKLKTSVNLLNRIEIKVDNVTGCKDDARSQKECAIDG